MCLGLSENQCNFISVFLFLFHVTSNDQCLDSVNVFVCRYKCSVDMNKL